MKLNSSEKKSTLTIAVIISLRLLGIFLILPVFSVYTIDYPGSTLTLAGLAFGIYALTQSLLQIPFGWASDKYGRKKILILGLILFSVGSIICALAGNIYELIIARALQGSGAVGSVAIASLGDTTRPQVRAQAFTITGIVIGISFVVSLVLGPLLAIEIGFNSLFYVLAFLGVVAIIITSVLFPTIKKEDIQTQSGQKILDIIRNRDIKLLLIAAFVLSFVLNLFLFIYPLSWTTLNTSTSNFWLIYLIILLPSGLITYPFIKYSEKNNQLKRTIKIAFIFLLLGFLIYFIGNKGRIILFSTGILFFLGHTIFQSILPAFLTQRISSENRGISSGVYNLANFFGASIGGMSSGFLYSKNLNLPLIVSLIILSAWILIGLPNQPDKENLE
jgi:MFS family permease